MKNIIETRPFNVNPVVKALVLRLSMDKIHKKDNFIYLIDYEEKNNNHLIALKLLEKYQYISWYSKMINFWNWIYKEKWANKPINLLKRNEPALKYQKIYYKVYLNDNILKWEYIKKLSWSNDIKINIDENLINIIILKYRNKDKNILKYINDLQLKYIYACKNKEVLTQNELHDFLYYILENFPEEIQKLNKENNSIDINKITSISILNSIVKSQDLKPIMELTSMENKIINLLKNWPSNKKNIRTITQQTEWALVQSLKILRKKIKDNNINKYLEIRNIRAEKTYILILNGIEKV